MQSSLRSVIREMLLQEEVFGSLAFVYTGSHSQPWDVETESGIIPGFIPMIVNDDLQPGKGKGGLYGKGLYTVYDLAGTNTENGFYGKYIYKLAINLYGYLCFDRDVATKVYGKPLTVIEQMELLQFDKDVIDAAREIISKIPSEGRFTSKQAQPISLYVRGIVKGLVFTGMNDGRVAVVFDASTVTPVAYRTTRAKLWKKVDKATRAQTVGRTQASWREERYEENKIEKLKRMRSKLEMFRRLGTNPDPKDLIIDGDLDLSGGLSLGLNPDQLIGAITEIPDGLQVSGNLVIANVTTRLPNNLKVGGNLVLFFAQVKEIPDGLEVGGTLSLSQVTERIGSGVKVGKDLGGYMSKITELPNDIQVGGSINLNNSQVVRLPDNLTVNGDLNLTSTPIRELPAGLHVTGKLELKKTNVSVIPDDLEADDGLYLDYGFPNYNIPNRLLNGRRKDGMRKVWTL